MVENFGALFILNEASVYLINTQTLSLDAKADFRVELYNYLSGKDITEVSKPVVSFLKEKHFLTEDELKLLEKKENLSKENAGKEEDSEPEA